MEALLRGVRLLVRNLRWVADGAHVAFDRIELRLAAERDDDPPMIREVRLEVRLDTDATARRVAGVVERALERRDDRPHHCAGRRLSVRAVNQRRAVADRSRRRRAGRSAPGWGKPPHARRFSSTRLSRTPARSPPGHRKLVQHAARRRVARPSAGLVALTMALHAHGDGMGRLSWTSMSPTSAGRPQLGERQAPAMQPAYEPRSARCSGVRRRRRRCRVMPIRPPGRRTRAISRNTAGLSAARLMTQLLMTTSTEAAGSGIASIVPLEELDVGRAGFGGVALGQGEHLVGHVEAERAAGRSDPPGGEQDVDAAARAQVEHALALAELGDGGRVAAAQRGEHRRVGELTPFECAVQLGSDSLLRAAAGTAAGGRTPEWA